jgi:hypothetical protein
MGKSDDLSLNQIKQGILNNDFELLIDVEFENDGYFQFLKPNEALDNSILDKETKVAIGLEPGFSNDPDFNSERKVFGEASWVSIGSALVNKKDAVEMINDLIEFCGDCTLKELNDDYFTEWHSETNYVYDAKKFFEEFKYEMVSSRNYFEDSSNNINEQIGWSYSTLMFSQWYELKIK